MWCFRIRGGGRVRSAAGRSLKIRLHSVIRWPAVCTSFSGQLQVGQGVFFILWRYDWKLLWFLRNCVRINLGQRESRLFYRPVNNSSNSCTYQLPSNSTYGISKEYSRQTGSNKLIILHTQITQATSFGIPTCVFVVSAWGLISSLPRATKLLSFGIWHRESNFCGHLLSPYSEQNSVVTMCNAHYLQQIRPAGSRCLCAFGFSFRTTCRNFPNLNLTCLIHSGNRNTKVPDFCGEK